MLHQFLLDHGLTQSSHDPSMYFFKHGGDLRGLIVVHVDDLSITGQDEFTSRFILSIKSKFEISKDDRLSHCLSLQISRETSTNVSINQSHYIDDLVEKFLGLTVTPVKTPTADDFKLLIPNESKTPFDKPYSSLVGGLLWVAQCSRPDISFAVNRLLQFLKNPSLKHWEAAV